MIFPMISPTKSDHQGTLKPHKSHLLRQEPGLNGMAVHTSPAPATRGGARDTWDGHFLGQMSGLYVDNHG